MTVLILCTTNFSLFVRNYLFHENPRPSQVRALTNQPNRHLRGYKGYGGQKSSSILLGRSVCFVFFPRNIHDLSTLFNSKNEDQDGDAQARLLARCSL